MAERPIALPPVTGGTVATDALPSTHFGAFDPNVAAILVAAYNKALADLADKGPARSRPRDNRQPHHRAGDRR